MTLMPFTVGDPLAALALRAENGLSPLAGVSRPVTAAL
jgi:hypothetical protein